MRYVATPRLSTRPEPSPAPAFRSRGRGRRSHDDAVPRTPAAVADLVATHGPVLTGAVATPSTLSRAATRGELVALLPGVYVVAARSTELAVRLAAVAAWRPEAVVCGAAAASLSFWPELPVEDIELAADSRLSRPGFRITRSVVPTDQVRWWGRVRVMAPALAALDLAGRLGGDPIDRALRSRRITLDQLWDALAAAGGRPGNAQRRRLLVRSRTLPWSAAERYAHQVFDDHGLRGWVANRATWTAAGALYYPDIAFLDCKLAIEIDGRFHHDDLAVFENDRARQNALVRDGWTVLRFTYRQLQEDPAAVVAQVRETLTGLRRRTRSRRSAQI